MSEQQGEKHESPLKTGSCEGGEAEATAIKGASSEAAGSGLTEHETLVAELSKAKAEASDYYDKYLRTLAELDNLRRRVDREKADMRKFGLESFLREMLPVLDSFDKALGSIGPSDTPGSSFIEGIHLVKRQLFEILERQGLAPVEADGARFDPNLHQAIQQVESPEVSEETVAQEYSRGYTLHGRLLRPAMVSVQVPVAKHEES